MREVICINVGQAGVQIANASWELLCVEHGIEATGKLKLNLVDDDSTAFKTFFQELRNGHFVPRSLQIDLEPTVIDEVRKGSYRDLFHPDYLLNIIEDACSNYARGHFTIGKKIMPKAKNSLRCLIENCNHLQGFFLMHSTAGGTGAGLTSLIGEMLSTDYAKLSRYCMSIFPSPVLSTSCVEPYNTLMSLRDTLDKSDIINIFNNEAIFGMCTDLLDINHPTFSNINRILTHVFSDITVSLRFESTLNSDLNQIGTNLIPFPKVHYIMASHSPMCSQARSEHEKLTVNLLTRNLFRSNHQLITSDMTMCSYMACVLQYRGDVSPQEVTSLLSVIRKRREIKFVDWCPTGFKVGINCQPPSMVKASEMAPTLRSASSLVNCSVVTQPISVLLRKFDILFAKRSFVHWYVGEGMEEGEFNEARDDIAQIILDYDEISYIPPEEEEEQEPEQPKKGRKKKRDEQSSIKEAAGTQDDMDDGGRGGSMNIQDDDRVVPMDMDHGGREDSMDLDGAGGARSFIDNDMNEAGGMGMGGSRTMDEEEGGAGSAVLNLDLGLEPNEGAPGGGNMTPRMSLGAESLHGDGGVFGEEINASKLNVGPSFDMGETLDDEVPGDFD